MTAQKLKDFPYLEYGNIHILGSKWFLITTFLSQQSKHYTADFLFDTNHL